MEEKLLIPAYKRTDRCERCGADVYAPELKEGGWPLMSACVCEQGPQIAGRERKGTRQSGQPRAKEHARAA